MEIARQHLEKHLEWMHSDLERVATIHYLHKPSDFDEQRRNDRDFREYLYGWAKTVRLVKETLATLREVE